MPDPAQNTPPDAPRIPGYELRELLGKGGQGSVYRARQKSLNRVVAIKVLDRAHAEDRIARKRFLAEARLQSKLHHPNILQGIDINSHDGVWFFVMEFVSGTNGHQLLVQRGRPLGETEALEIGRQVADALAHAFERSIVHGDIKPENIVLGADGAVKMIDFGIARLAREQKRKGPRMGTAEFMAPEVSAGTSVGDIRSDFFSLGVTLYELMTGTLPPLAKVTPERGPDPREREPSLSTASGTLISQLLAGDPKHRPESPRALVTSIEAAIAGRPPKPVVSPSKDAAAKAGGNPVMARAAIGAGLVAVAVILFVASGMGGTEQDTPAPANGGAAEDPKPDPIDRNPPPDPTNDPVDPLPTDPDTPPADVDVLPKPAPDPRPDTTKPLPRDPPQMVFLPDELAVYEGDPIRFHITARNLPAAFEPTLKILDEQGRDISATVDMPKIVRDAEDHATVMIEWKAPYAVRHTSHKIAVLVSQPPLQKRLWIQIDDRNRPPRGRADVNGKVTITEGDTPKTIDLIGLDPDEDVVEFELIKADEGIDVDLTDDKLVVTVPDRPGDQGGTDRIVTLRAVDDTDGETTFRVPIQIVDVDHAPRIAWDIGKSPFVVIKPTRDGGTTVLRGASKPGLNALLSIKDPDRPNVVFKLDFPKGERPRGMAIKPAEAGNSRLTWRSQGREGWGPRTFVMVASAEGEPSRSLPVRIQVMRRIEPAAGTSSDPVDRAFDWLRRHQLPDGSFPISGRDFARFSDDEDAWGTGREEHRVGIAALAVIAALRAGDASPWVSTAVRHIVSAQDAEGRVASRGQGWIYSQALATEALALAWHLLGDSKLRRPASKAVKFLLDARQPDTVAGWRYKIRDSESDTSVTAWALRALLAARMARLPVDDETLRGGLAFVESMMADDGRIGYQEIGGAPIRPSSRVSRYLPKLSESLTAGGLSVLLRSPTVNAADPRVKAAVRLILSCPPAWSFSSRPGATLLQKLTYEEKRQRNKYSPQDFYYWQHATFLFRTWRIVRGKTVHKNSDWKGMTTFAKAQQKKAGDARGSWDPNDAWGSDGGRSYATAMIALAIVNSVFDDPLVGER